MTSPTTPTVAALYHPALALTVLRVIVGITFMAHGYQKFFMYTLPGTTAAFTKMGAPLPTLTAPAVATLELLGGLALVLGLGTRFVAPLLALNMLGAIALVHLKAGFFNPDGVEFPLLLLASAVALTIGGAGAYALDNTLNKRAG